MRITLKLQWPSGGSFSTEIGDEDPIVSGLLSDDEQKECENGGTLSESIIRDPNQTDFGKQLFQFAGDIARFQSAAVQAAHYTREDQKREEAALEAADMRRDHDERLEAR